MKMYFKGAVAAIVALSMLFTGCAKTEEPAAPASESAAAEEAAPEETASEAPAEEAADAASGEVVKIGVMQPLTGANAGGGELEANGSILAQELYPTVLDKKLELVIVDNKSDKVEAATVATRLVENEKVAAIIGSWGSSLSMAAGNIVKDAKIPAVAPSATNPLVTKDNEFYFRVCFIDPFQGTVMSNYAYNTLQAKSVAIIKEVSSDYSVGLAKFFTDNWTTLTGDASTITAEVNYNTGDQDFSAQLTTIKSANPDVIFAPGNFTESALIIKQARQLGITAPIIGGDTWETADFLSVGGPDVEGVVFSSFFDVDKPLTAESEKFITEYRNKFGEDPSAYAALGYDSYLIIRQAIENAGTADSVAIQQALLNMKDFEGATGKVNFDADRNAIKSAVLKTVKDGKFTFVGVVEP